MLSSAKWLIHVSCVLYIPPGNSRSYQQWMHTVKVFLESCISYLNAFIFAFFFLCFSHFTPELYLIESMIDTTQCLKSCRRVWNEGGCLNVQIQRECSLVCEAARAAGQWRQTGRGDRSDLTWQDVLRHDMLIWQQTQALLRWTDPRT